MAPITDASWRRSGSPEQLEPVSKRSKFIYAKTDELFVRRADSSSIDPASLPTTSAKDNSPASSSSSASLETKTASSDSSSSYTQSSSSIPAPSRSSSATEVSATPSSSSSAYSSSYSSSFSDSSSASSTNPFTSSSSTALPTSSASSSSLAPSSKAASASPAPRVFAAAQSSATPSPTPNKSAVSSGAGALQVVAAARPQNLVVAGSDATPALKVQAAPTVIPFTTTDDNGQTFTGSSTVMTTSTSGALSGDGSAPQPNVGLIAGAAIGGILALLLVFACIFFVNRRSRKRHEMDESTKPHPFTAQRAYSGGVSMPRDVESQRGPNAMVASQPSTVRRGPSSAFASRFGAEADRGNSVKPRPPALPLKDPFVDPPATAYENVSLSPAKPSEKLQTRGGPSNAAHNPFADPARAQAASGDREPKTPGSRGYNRGLERVRNAGPGGGAPAGGGGGGGAEVNRSASTRTLTNTAKVVGLPSRPKSAAPPKTPRTVGPEA